MVRSVSRRVIPWLLSVPLMLAGTEVAHFLAFRFVYPDAWERNQALQQSGHGYFGLLPLLAGIALALVLCAVFFDGRAARRDENEPGTPTSLPRFAALPPLAFMLQEHLESLIHSGSVSGVVIAPTFLIGLLLTLPFGAAAYLVARALSGVSKRVGQALSRRGPTHLASAPESGLSWFAVLLSPPRAAALAGGHAERGPPSNA